MSLTFHKIIMVILLCLTFVGQTLASTVMPYHMANMKGMTEHQQPQSMSTMSKVANTSDCHEMTSQMSSHVSQPKTAGSEQSAKNCCAESCHCVTGGCASIMVLINSIDNDTAIDFSSKISSFAHLKKSQILTSLFKPPIIS